MKVSENFQINELRIPFKQIQLSSLASKTLLRTLPFPVSVERIFTIAWKAPVVDLFFSKVTGAVSAFHNFCENSVTCNNMFRKVALLEISRNFLLTGVVGLQSIDSYTT